MRPRSFAAQILLSAAFTVGIVACSDAPEEQTNNAQAADVDVLPADESVATPSDDLENGAVEAPAQDNAAADANTY